MDYHEQSIKAKNIDINQEYYVKQSKRHNRHRTNRMALNFSSKIEQQQIIENKVKHTTINTYLVKTAFLNKSLKKQHKKYWEE